VVLELVLGRLNRPLVTAAAPLGIVTFELAHSVERSAAILASWNAEARASARMSLIVDYLFMIAYPATLAIGCVTVAARISARWPGAARVARTVAAGALVAGALDAVENAALLVQLSGGAAELPALIAWGCATVKFALVVMAIPVAVPALWLKPAAG
jgi:hypothetical protein